MTAIAHKSILVRATESIASLRSVWFGPGTPNATVAGNVQARTFDYLSNTNFVWTPRKNERITYRYLRALADGSYMSRVVLETVKDRISAKPWHFKLKSKPGEVNAANLTRSVNDTDVQMLTDHFRFPDKEHTWGEWLKMWLEDTLVIDAASILIERSYSGQILRTIVIDGATINRNIDGMGMTPTDFPAYQQIIKGAPAVNLMIGDLLYAPRSLRAHKLWGCSPIEQTIMLVETAVMRAIWQKGYYDAGNVPLGYINLPETWSADEMTRFMKEFRNTLDGNLDERNKLYPIPGTGKMTLLKQEDAHQMFDEWIARVLCYAIGETASPFIKQNNRATSQQNDDTREESSEKPLEAYVIDQMNKLVQSPNYFACPDVEFLFTAMPSTDPLVQAQVDQINITIKTRVPNELRARDGLSPLEGGDVPFVAPVPQLMAKNPEDPNAKDDKPPEKPTGKALAAAKGAKRVVVRPTDADAKQVAALGKKLAPLFKTQAKAIAAAASAAYAEAVKADAIPEDELAKIIAAAEAESWSVLVDPTSTALAVAGKRANALVFAQLGVAEDAELFDLVNEKALAWAQARAAEMVGMRWVDGELVTNPNAQWAITDTTRDNLRSLVSDAFENGVSVPDLATQIREMTDFSAGRAQMIAETEIGNAHVKAGWESAVSYGADQKEWLVTNDENECEACADFGDLGPMPMDYEYEPGLLSPLAHPRCFAGDTPVSAFGVTATFKRWFQGEVVRISLSNGSELTVTPNHPILSRRGWIAAGLLERGQEVVSVTNSEALASHVDPDDHYVEASIQEIVRSFDVSESMATSSMPLSAIAFHGDASKGDEVTVVRTNSDLSGKGNRIGYQASENLGLPASERRRTELPGNSMAALALEGNWNAADRRMGSTSTLSADLRPGVFSLEGECFTYSPDGEARPPEGVADCRAMAAEVFGKVNAGLAAHVGLVKVLELTRIKEWSGHVYNLSTKSRWYLAGSIISHNCQCDIAITSKDWE